MLIEKYKKELEKIENLIHRNRIAYYNTDNEIIPGMKELRETYMNDQNEESIQLTTKYANNIHVVLDFLNAKDNDYLVYTNYEFINASLFFHEGIDQSLYHFSYKEKLEIIMYFVKKNLNHHLLDLDENSFKNYIWKTYYAHLSEEVFKKLYAEELLKTGKSNNNAYFRKVLSKGKREWQLKKKVCVAHRVIKKHYFDKKENFSEKDLSFVIQSLIVLGLDSKMCDVFKVLFKKKIKIKKEEKVVVPKIEIKLLDQKESKRLYREIMDKYNIDEQRVIRPLTLSEIVFLVKKMHRINISQKEIIKFILNVNKEGLEAYKNSRYKFQDYYPKIVEYASKETITLLNSYLNEMMVKQSYADYSFWKENMEKIFKEGLLEVRDVYQYELNEGMKIY